MARRSHRHRKFNRYTNAPSKRKKGFSPHLIILISAIAAIIFGVILGNTLKNKVEELPPSTEDTENEPPLNSTPTLDAESINGIAVTLKSITDNTYYEVLSQIPSETTAVSLTLFDENDVPYYASSVTASFGKSCGELTLKRVFDAVGEDIYASVIFPSTALINTEEEKQAVLTAYEAALIRELYDAGADDVIITAPKNAIGIDDAFIERLSDLVYLLRRYCPTLRIGISLPAELVADSGHALTLEKLSKAVDILALDLTDHDDKDSFTDVISRASINILRREMRLILKSANEKELLALTDLLDSYGMYNRQVVAK